MAEQVCGDELKVGDTIEFLGHRLTILTLRPYSMLGHDCRIVTFAQSHTGMTIEPQVRFTRFD